ncbi:hypothetical protein EVJ58_g8210 [Rhodofomes roseus]|uniref:Uncharacterized protein n=1 Tax=Rhodofomes roseus TaxID=34475 RepID=A0A4Y9Y1B1_9APHY|nr:hypothetical protein EVJ58_g8210 [Rhodofomes roseus]
MLPILHLLVGPELRHLRIGRLFLYASSKYAATPALKSILGAIQSTCPLLESITFDTIHGGSAELSRVLGPQLTRHHNLKSIRCPGVALAIHDVVKLSSLPSLASLQINLSFDGLVRSSLHASRSCHPAEPVTTFPSLRELDIQRCDAQSYLQFASIKLPVVEDFKLTLDMSTHRSCPRPLFAVIASQCNPETLSVVKLRDDRLDDDLITCPNFAVSASNLRHFLAFRHLRYLNIDTRTSCTEYDDEVLVEMATAWPKLEHLHVNAGVRKSGWRRSSSVATVLGLSAFAKRCPGLTHLGLLLDAHGPQTDEEHFVHGHLHTLHNLEVIHWGWSTVRGQLESVASMLSYLFPTDVQWRRGGDGFFHMEPEAVAEDEDSAEKWDKVMALYPVMYRVRQQERERARRLVASGDSSAI